MGDIAISVQGVSKYYKLYNSSRDRLKEALHPWDKKYHHDFYAIRNLNLDVKRGEILGIVGRNGCGKSTLLKLITGVLTPNSGNIAVKGKISALLELGAGFNPEFTGRQNIRFYATILGLDAKEIEVLTPDIIDFAELGEFIDQPVKTYSSGMKSRLGFAVAVHIEPDILILDEVLAVGDALFKRKCYAKMEEFFKSGKTILFVSHDANSVNQLCNRAVLLYGGAILMDGTPKEVTKYYEKLIFASEKNTDLILEEIKKLGESSKQADAATMIKQSLPKQAKGMESYYIPELISKSALKYESDRAIIVDPHFTTLSGKRVNVLVSGEDYIYTYKVKFNSPARNVSLGMQIKNAQGMVITGSSIHYDKGRLINEVEAGNCLIVKWSLHCSLLSGVFFTNAGVSEIVDGEPVFITRIVDAAVFKVIFDDEKITRGVIDMRQSLEWEFT